MPATAAPVPPAGKGNRPVDCRPAQPPAGLRLNTPCPTRYGPCLRSTAGCSTTSAAWPSITCCTPPANGRWISVFSVPFTLTGVVSTGIPMFTSPSPAAVPMSTVSGRKLASARTPCASDGCGISVRCC